MGKRRTREEKKSANYGFLWNLNQSINYHQISKESPQDLKQAQLDGYKPKENIKKLDKDFTSIKKDIAKSLSLTTFILILEIALYFIWR